MLWKKSVLDYFLVPSCGTAKCDIDTRTTYLFIGRNYLSAKLAAVLVCFGKSNFSSLDSSGTTSRNSIRVRSHFQDSARRSTACYYEQSRCKMNQPHISLEYASAFIGPRTHHTKSDSNFRCLSQDRCQRIRAKQGLNLPPYWWRTYSRP